MHRTDNEQQGITPAQPSQDNRPGVQRLGSASTSWTWCSTLSHTLHRNEDVASSTTPLRTRKHMLWSPSHYHALQHYTCQSRQQHIAMPPENARTCIWWYMECTRCLHNAKVDQRCHDEAHNRCVLAWSKWRRLFKASFCMVALEMLVSMRPFTLTLIGVLMTLC